MWYHHAPQTVWQPIHHLWDISWLRFMKPGDLHFWRNNSASNSWRKDILHKIWTVGDLQCLNRPIGLQYISSDWQSGRQRRWRLELDRCGVGNSVKSVRVDFTPQLSEASWRWPLTSWSRNDILSYAWHEKPMHACPAHFWALLVHLRPHVCCRMEPI